MRVDRLRMLPVVLLAAVAACSGGPAPGPAAQPPTPQPPTAQAPTPQPPTAQAPTPRFPPVPQPDPVAVCTNQLTYWAGEQLRGAPDVGYDYQHMALTAAQAQALRELVDEARERGATLPDDRLRARARELCAGPTAVGVLVCSSAL